MRDRFPAALTFALAVGAGAALTGCFTELPDDPPAPGLRAETVLGATIHGESAPATLVATYMVPVPGDLVPYATYDLDRVSVDLGATLTLSFPLPVGLLGRAVPVTFTGVASGEGTLTVTGAGGFGTCLPLDGTGFECELEYYPLQADLAAVRAYWEARGDLAVDARLTVSSLFEADPLGVVRVVRR